MKISLDNPVLQVLDKFGNIMIVNFCFIIFSLPIITIGASTTAMYRCFLTMAKDGTGGMIKLFWDAFRLNLKKSLLLELIIIPVLVMVGAEAVFYLAGLAGEGILKAVMYLLPIILVSCVLSYVFPLQAQFENKIKITLKNSALLAIMHFPATLFITAVNLIFPALFYFCTAFFLKFLVAWIFFGFGLCAYINTAFLRRIFEQYMPTEEKQEEDK